MLNRILSEISQNKNLLMLFASCIYVLALYATLSGSLVYFSLLLLIFSILAVVKGTFKLKYIFVFNLLFYLGVINVSLRLRDVDDLLNLAPLNTEITGKIVSIPQGLAEGKPKFFFEPKNIMIDSMPKDLKNEKALVMLDSVQKPQYLKIYNSIKLKGRLSAPFKAGNPSQFDYSNYLKNHGTYAVFYAKTIELIDKNLSFNEKILQAISDYREYVINKHAKYINSPYLEILGGIVFGDDAVSPTKEIKQSFANSGLLHILAASGMNVAFIYTFFFWIFSCLRMKFKLKVSLGMLMVIIYSLMTGLGASIIRATAMLLFVLVGKLIDRDAHSISLLSFVALLMLLYNPLFINDVGFQLSFIVTFGLLIMTPAIIKFNNKIYDYIIATITIPVIAQLWVIPLQIFYFSNISIYSVFANIMSVPILAVISFGGFISSLFSLITPISDFICRIFDFILNPFLKILVSISDFWGYLPNSIMQTSHPNAYQIFLYYLILLCCTGLLYKEFREKYFKPLFLSLGILIVIWLITLIPQKNSDLEILCFDLGNADSFLIKTPKQEYVLIDTGRAGYKGGKSQAEIVILKYLKDRGIKNIDSLVVTHFDNDHCGGVVDILNGVLVKNVYVNDLNHDSNAAKRIYRASISNGTKVILANNNQIIYNKNDLKLSNLLGPSTDNDNENSIMTFLSYKDFTMFFTGDAGAIGIRDVLDSIPQDISVLKVPHHGAIDGLTPEIINYLKPKYSILSVGENKFGHPATYTLELLKDSKILRTDIDNSVLFKVNRSGAKVYMYDLDKRKFVLDGMLKK